MGEAMNMVAVVQARMGSTLLPSKVMKLINGIPMIETLLRRLSRAQELDQIIVAFAIDARNQPLLASSTEY